ncbi:MAG: type II secretion system F family protein [Alphaproteobacteria bacterium]|jgi:type IV pilus assembly protein PilC|nr:type II secretion system F family protein [Alphaproteobacteria bacterium]
MTHYAYAGVQGGKKVKGKIEATSLARARSALRQKRVRIKNIKELKEKKKGAMDIEITWGPFGSIPAKEILMFTKKLSTMIRAGLPILDSLIMVAGQTKNPNMKRAVTQMVEALNDGVPLSEAFKKQSRHFDNVYLNMIEAGEVSGMLDKFIDKLVEILEKQQKIKSGIKSAMFYPITLITVSLGISIFMLTNVVPTFQEMYEGMGIQLPGPTQAIVDASEWIADIGNVAGVFGTIFGIITFQNVMLKYVKPYRTGWHALQLKMPIFGGIIMMAVVARSSLLMANLFAAGVSVLETLNVASTVTTNTIFLNAFARVKRDVMTGAELSSLFANEKVFPTELSQLIAVGERTGNMEEMLNSIANYYEEEFDALVEGLSTVIEPVMIVFVGGLVGMMVVALYLPIFSAGDLAGG